MALQRSRILKAALAMVGVVVAIEAVLIVLAASTVSGDTATMVRIAIRSAMLAVDVALLALIWRQPSPKRMIAGALWWVATFCYGAAMVGAFWRYTETMRVVLLGCNFASYLIYLVAAILLVTQVWRRRPQA